MAKTSSELDRLIRTSGADPFRFEDILTAWNSYFLDPKKAPSEPQMIGGLNDAADQALLFLAEESNQDVIAPTIRAMLERFSHPALIIRADDKILAVNEAALRRLNVDPGDDISRLAFSLNDGRTLSQALGLSLAGRNNAGDIDFLNCINEKNKTATLAVVRTNSAPQRSPTALVFVIDPVWRKSAEAVLVQAFHLTDAEAKVLMAFLDGASLRDIAAERGRSLTTVRTQLQTVMSKMGVQTQAELMRNAFALSQFLGEIDAIAEVATHPHRRRAEVLRPGGRTLELVLSGDLSGQPVIFLSDVTQFTFPAVMEARFKAAGLCVISLCRPGAGTTSPPLAGSSYEACLAGDIIAVLGQLGRPRAKLMAHSLSSAIACRLGALLSEHISEVVIIAALIPRPFLKASNINSPWASALHAAMDQSPKLFALMVQAGVRAWKVLGTRRFVALQLGRYAPDVALAARPEIDAEFAAAMAMTVKQGNEALAQDLQTAMGDWSAWVSDCPVPMTLIHGENDPGANIKDVRDFARAFDGKLQLIELAAAGFMTVLSHPGAVLAALGETAHGSSS